MGQGYHPEREGGTGSPGAEGGERGAYVSRWCCSAVCSIKEQQRK